MGVFSIVVSCVSMCGTSVAIFYALKNGKKTDEKDIEKRVADNTRINIKLDDIASKTSDIKVDLQNIFKSVQSHDVKLTELEMRCKSLEEKVKVLESK